MLPTRDEEREYLVSRQALLDVEAASAELLFAATEDLGRNPAAAEAELEQRILQVLLASRRAARAQSRRRFDAEFGITMAEARRYGLRPVGPLPLLSRAVPSDVQASGEMAALVAREFRRRAEVGGVRTAAAASRRRLAAAAQATTADAWADERERVLRAAAQEYDGVDVFPALARRWDARLDACPVCQRLNGTIRPLGVGFPSGAVAGQVHHACRCSADVFFAPIYLGRSQAA